MKYKTQYLCVHTDRNLREKTNLTCRRTANDLRKYSVLKKEHNSPFPMCGLGIETSFQRGQDGKEVNAQRKNLTDATLAG